LGEIKHNNNGINLGTQHPTSSNDSEAAVVLFLSDSHAFRMWLSQKNGVLLGLTPNLIYGILIYRTSYEGMGHICIQNLLPFWGIWPSIDQL
jgi:hypothetical protein